MGAEGAERRERIDGGGEGASEYIWLGVVGAEGRKRRGRAKLSKVLVWSLDFLV